MGKRVGVGDVRSGGGGEGEMDGLVKDAEDVGKGMRNMSMCLRSVSWRLVFSKRSGSSSCRS